MSELYCGECGGRFGEGTDYVWIDVELRRIADRNGKDEYAFHPQCWRKRSEEWVDPV